MEAGCVGYLTKPIDTRNFLEVVSGYIGFKETVPMPETNRPTDHRGAKILIVDDDPKNVKLMRLILGSSGYELLSADNGTAAIEMVDQHQPDVLLLDVMMPGLNGYEVTRHIKGNPETESIPIILVTALDGREDKLRGMDAGAEEFLTKPVNPVEIETRVASMLKLKRYRDQLDIRSRSSSHVCAVDTRAGSRSGSEGPGRILVVEDNEKDLKLLLSHLPEYADQVDIASDGKEALRMLSQGQYKLALVDIMLPEKDGFQICKKIKAEDETRDIQVILITCLNDLENKIRGVELGADDYLIKPFDPRELKARVKALLKKNDYLEGLHALYEKALNSALMDGLTSLYNHIYFKRFLDLEIKRSHRQGHTTSLLMIDLDDFKQINDALGHTAGDEILKSFGSLLKSTIREIDVAARYGGEEFVVVLPYGDRSALSEVGGRICEAASRMSIPERWREAITGCTVSIGGAVYPDDAGSLEDLIEKADYMLYKAKKGGKNRVCIVPEHPAN